MKKSILSLCLVLVVITTMTVLFACGDNGSNGGSNHEHAWDNGTVTKEATCSESGILVYSCNGCSETKTEDIAKLAHTEVTDSMVPASCTSTGLTEGKHCSVCNEVIVAQSIIYKTEHDYVNDVCTICGYEIYTDGLVFSLNAGEADYSVVGYTGSNKDVVIPNKYKGLPVVTIGIEAFKENSVIKTIRIPNSVTTIEEKAFYECKELTSIVIPASVNVIKNGTFYKCEELDSVTLLGNIRGIGNEAFMFCESLGSITLPSTCESIGEDAFSCCYGFSSINLPEGLTYIGPDAFHQTYLTSITLPSTLNTIHASVFSNCDQLRTVTISEGVQKIEGYAFRACKGLQTIHIPASVTTVEAYAFAYCDLLKNITVAENNLVYDSRNNCKGIVETATNTLVVGGSSTTIYDTVTAIGEGAFFGSGVSNIYIPESVVIIGNSAFSMCKDLSSITIPSGVTEIADGLLSGCSFISTINITGNVTRIGESAFNGTIRLQKIILPASITYIGERAFTNASTNAIIYYRGNGMQWNEIDNHDAVALSNYQNNGKMVFNYDGE